MSSPIRILFLIDFFHGTGGTERHLSLLVRNLCREAFDVTVVAFDLGTNPLIDEMRQAGSEVFQISVARVYTPNAWVQAWRLFRLMRKKRIDIVQTYHQKADTYGAIVARLAGVRHIISSRRDCGEFKTRPYVILSRLIRAWFEKVIVVSDSVADAVVRNEGVDRADVVKIYNGVDADALRPPTPEQASRGREALGFGPGDFVVGMVANFRPEKKHDVLFAGALEAREQVPRLKLLLIGAGPLLEQYRTQFREPAGGIDVLFTGAVHDVPRYLPAMDVGCLISIEGFSNAVLEKMAIGLPMVVSNVGGNAEAVVEGRNGFLVPLNDAGALARALVALHADPTRRSAMGRESRRLVEERFSLESMWRSHEALYRALCSDDSGRPADLLGAEHC